MHGTAKAKAETILGHLSFGINDIDRAAAFYDLILAPLGFVRVRRR